MHRGANVFIAVLRLLIGYAFVPSGLKKTLDQPFTDPANQGLFHDFLHAFHATGFFYQFVGVVQLTIALLLMTQTFATLGALMALPVFATITVFCWATATVFTSTMVTLMLCGAILLALWDFEKWRGIFHPGSGHPPAPEPEDPLPIDLRLWGICGAGILVLYFGVCAYSGGIYRPKSVELDNPAFYIFPLIALFPVVTYVIEHRRRKRHGGST